MAANPSELTRPTNVSDIRNARAAERQAEVSDEKRMLAALEQISDCTEAIRQDLTNFQNLIERLVLSQRVL
jgi:hypothetical protein